MEDLDSKQSPPTPVAAAEEPGNCGATSSRKDSPELRANILSRLFYCWLNPLFKVGNQRTIEVSDLYNVLKRDSSKYLCDRLERNWQQECRKAQDNNNARPSLRWALFKTFGFQYILWGVVILLEESVRIIQALFLGALIRYFDPKSEMQTWEAYLYALAIGLCAIIPAITHHPYFQQVFRFGMWMRIACCSLIYRKSLKLSCASLGKATVGHMVNLMSNDVFRLDMSAVFLHYLVIGPLMVVAVFILLWYKISWSAITGMATLLLLLPVQGFFGGILARFRSKIAEFTDERLRLINELLCSMRIVKMYCWENFFRKLISDARRQETKRIMHASYARALLFSPMFSSQKLIAFVTFLTYVLTGHVMTAEIVFVTLSLFSPVRFAMTFCVPLGIQYGSEAVVTIRRLEEFLLLDERSSDGSAVGNDGETKRLPSVIASNITASWSEDVSRNVLQDVNFSVSNGELMTVIGPVGAGKSSLLMAILGEIPVTKGEVGVLGRVAYASQQAWVFSASVRQNITFGQPFDAAKYKRVIEAAALVKDLELLSKGDETLVGERGVSLSGGQKARISLARALYVDADVYLLDDPLSAVDPHVAKHIFKRCICGLLKNKVRILVTHQIHFLQAADKILVLNTEGGVRIGTYEELSKGGVDFESLIESIEVEAAAKAQHGNELHDNSDTTAADTDVQSHLLPTTPTRKFSRLSHASSKESLSKRAISNGLIKEKAISTISLASAASIDINNLQGEFVPEVQEEEVSVGGGVKMSLYVRYFFYGGGIFGFILCLILNLLAQSSFVFVDWWLAYWCNIIEVVNQSNALTLSLNGTQSLSDLFSDNMTTADVVTDSIDYTSATVATLPTMKTVDNMFYLTIFAILTAAVLILALLRALQIFHMLVQSAVKLHSNMLHCILRCPMMFFDTNPVGRILNRFSKDLGQIEEILPFFIYDFIQCSLLVIAIILVVGVVNPWLFIPVVPLCALFLYIRHYYLKTGRCLKRIEAVTKSPVFSHISSTILGLQTIRAYRAEHTFTEEFDNHQDLHTSAAYLFFVTSRWFAVRLEWLCAIFITLAAILSVAAAQSLNGGLVGLSLSYVIALMALFQWAVRQSTEVESLMTSVERMVEYSELTSEAAVDSNVSNSWPQTGEIRAENVSLQYTPTGPIVLNDLNFNIRHQEKVGIVGRTGAGKSSLITVFFRLAEPSGRLFVDGVDIKTVGLNQVRGGISIIPQDPVLLKGTLRRNLDPTGLYSDLQLWYALDQVEMKSAVKEMPNELQFEISEGGSNISVGQRQLVCLARAILKSNKILIIDEATANVDPRTDSLIQTTIRQQFQQCTVLTIAHRLNTIIDSDRIMVLDEGRIREFDTPYNLLTNVSTVFYSMAQQTGPEEFNRLLQKASASRELPASADSQPPQ